MIALILAGGGGTRLWPFSRTMNPKQFLNLGSSDVSLLQDTYLRLAGKVPAEKVFIVGSKAHEFELQRQMERIEPAFPLKNILLEPIARNTAPAILWGVAQLKDIAGDEVVVVLPADHLIQKPREFLNCLDAGERMARGGRFVTFGIRPSRPETGYGYIKAGAKLPEGFEVERFVEKPNRETAEAYLLDKSYTWNAGIFMATVDLLLEEFQAHSPAMHRQFMTAVDRGLDLNNAAVAEEIFRNVVGDSIDYAVLEKSQRVAVLPVDIDWSDLGSWESIHQVSVKDDSGNVIRGNVTAIGTRDSLVFSTRKLVATIGLKNIAVIETDDALLVADLSSTQDVKMLVETLRRNSRSETQFGTVVSRPWGSYHVLNDSPGYKIKLLEILPGRRMSMQAHHQRSEHWVVISGTAELETDEGKTFLTENQSAFIPKTRRHRLGNSGQAPVQIIEVQQGEQILEDDIERFEDDYGRAPE